MAIQGGGDSDAYSRYTCGLNGDDLYEDGLQ